MHAKSLQLCLTLCDPMDWSPPGSFVHGIFQARILEWAAVSSSRGALQCNLKLASVTPPGLVIFLRITSAIPDLLWFHTNFMTFLFNFYEICCWDCWQGLTLWIALGNIGILTMLILLIHEHGLSFHYFLFSSISFNNVLQFSVYKSPPPWLSLFQSILFFLLWI